MALNLRRPAHRSHRRPLATWYAFLVGATCSCTNGPPDATDTEAGSTGPEDPQCAHFVQFGMTGLPQLRHLTIDSSACHSDSQLALTLRIPGAATSTIGLGAGGSCRSYGGADSWAVLIDDGLAADLAPLVPKILMFSAELYVGASLSDAVRVPAILKDPNIVEIPSTPIRLTKADEMWQVIPTPIHGCDLSPEP